MINEQLNFKYTLLIATDSFSSYILNIAAMIDHIPFVTLVVIINSSDYKVLESKYSAACHGSRSRFLAIPEKGKSNALNHYLKSEDGNDQFILFSDDDILIPEATLLRYVETVEKKGRGFFYGGSVDVRYNGELPTGVLKYFPHSITGLTDSQLADRNLFLGCNWGAFAGDIRNSGYFNPLFGPGSATGADGQEDFMMKRLLKNGIKPCAIFNAGVTHVLPDEPVTLEWLYRRKYRSGIKYGLLNKWKLPILMVLRLPLMLHPNKIKREIYFYHYLGIIHSANYIFKKI